MLLCRRCILQCPYDYEESAVLAFSPRRLEGCTVSIRIINIVMLEPSTETRPAQIGADVTEAFGCVIT